MSAPAVASVGVGGGSGVLVPSGVVAGSLVIVALGFEWAEGHHGADLCFGHGHGLYARQFRHL